MSSSIFLVCAICMCEGEIEEEGDEQRVQRENFGAVWCLRFSEKVQQGHDTKDFISSRNTTGIKLVMHISLGIAHK